MARAPFDKRISQLLTEPDVDLIEVRAFIDALQRSHAHAGVMLARYTSTFIIAWLLFYAIAAGLVGEGEVSTFKVSDPKLTLVVAPPALGLLFYLASVSASIWVVLTDTLATSYKHRLPSAYKLGLEELALTPSVLTVEHIVLVETEPRWLKNIHRFWLSGFAFCLYAGPVIAFMHIVYLLWRSDVYTTGSVVASAAIGAVLVVRGLTTIDTFTRLR